MPRCLLSGARISIVGLGGTGAAHVAMLESAPRSPERSVPVLDFDTHSQTVQDFMSCGSMMGDVFIAPAAPPDPRPSLSALLQRLVRGVKARWKRERALDRAPFSVPGPRSLQATCRTDWRIAEGIAQPALVPGAPASALMDALWRRAADAAKRHLRETLDRDLARIGGFGSALWLAARYVAAGTRARPLTESALRAWDGYAMSAWLAAGCGIEVRIHRANAVPAMLVACATRRVIWLDESLPREQRPFAVLHELAHWLLSHRANTEYALNPRRLCDAGIATFERQEREANAYARVLEAVLHALRAELAPPPSVERPGRRRHRRLPVREGGRAREWRRRAGVDWQARRGVRIFTPARARITRTGLTPDGQAFLSHGRVRRRDLRGFPGVHVVRAARGAARAEAR